MVRKFRAAKSGNSGNGGKRGGNDLAPQAQPKKKQKKAQVESKESFKDAIFKIDKKLAVAKALVEKYQKEVGQLNKEKSELSIKEKAFGVSARKHPLPIENYKKECSSAIEHFIESDAHSSVDYAGELAERRSECICKAAQYYRGCNCDDDIHFPNGLDDFDLEPLNHEYIKGFISSLLKDISRFRKSFPDEVRKIAQMVVDELKKNKTWYKEEGEGESVYELISEENSVANKQLGKLGKLLVG